jgi:divalent anion:Na+ symporter, DASS family
VKFSSSPWQGARLAPAALVILLGTLLWFAPHPEKLSDESWHLFTIFLTTIISIILKPLPLTPTVLIALTVTLATKASSFESLLSTYHKTGIWLIFIAFFFSRGIIQSGLATRMSYVFIRYFGKSTVGLAYSFIITDFLLSPFIPSLVARSLGVIFPILLALINNNSDHMSEEERKNQGRYLFFTCFQSGMVTSAMFLTSMAPSPMIAEIATSFDINLSWWLWAKASIVPGVLTLLLLPLVTLKIFPLNNHLTPKAPLLAQEKLNEMGRMTLKEWLMIAIFSIVLTLWIIGPSIGINSTVAAFIGLSLTLATGVLTWKQCLEEHAAWDTFLWLGGLIALGTRLNQSGFFNWLGEIMIQQTHSFTWPVALTILGLFYFYSHYIFASMAAHVAAMYSAFLATLILVGAPPTLSALVLAFLSALMGGLTHFSSGSAPAFFSAGFHTTKEWWKAGLIMSLFFLSIWGVVGSLWWKTIGLW